MTIVEYKRKKLAEVDYFLRGIRIGSNKGKFIFQIGRIKVNEKLVDGSELIVDGSELNFLNNVVFFRRAIYNIYRYRNSLKDTFDDDITGANTLEEVDAAVEIFVRRVMLVLDDLKKDVIEYLKEEKNILASNSFETSNFDFIEVLIGDKEYNWKSTHTLRRSVGKNDFVKKKRIDSVVSVLEYIYKMPDNIEDSCELKTNMVEFIRELEGCFILGSVGHKKVFSYHNEIKMLRQGKKAGIEKFEEVIEFIKAIIDSKDSKFIQEGLLSLENLNAFRSSIISPEKYDDLVNLCKAGQMLVSEYINNDVKHTK